jgi:ABC-2 type transport system permease protein
MMHLERVWAIVLRHLLLTFRSLDRIFNVFYWPLLNIVLWGITSVWLQQQAKESHIIAMILTGLILWQIVFRVNLETAKSLFEEIINQNLVNLFSTPLTLREWIAAIMILGIINMVLVMLCGIAAIWFLYGVNIFSLGWTLIPFMLLLLLSGWCIGFFICGLLIYWGMKAQDFIYTIGWLFAPFSAVYYPLAVLPGWVQSIARMLPMTYVFEGMRQVLKTGTISVSYLFLSFSLNILYLAGALYFFKHMFEKSKQKGLARLE